MSTVIKAWKAEADDAVLHVIGIVCDGGNHYHLITQTQFQYDTAEELDRHIRESIEQSFFIHDTHVWIDNTDEFDENPTIIRGEN